MITLKLQPDYRKMKYQISTLTQKIRVIMIIDYLLNFPILLQSLPYATLIPKNFPISHIADKKNLLFLHLLLVNQKTIMALGWLFTTPKNHKTTLENNCHVADSLNKKTKPSSQPILSNPTNYNYPTEHNANSTKSFWIEKSTLLPNNMQISPPPPSITSKSPINCSSFSELKADSQTKNRNTQPTKKLNLKPSNLSNITSNPMNNTSPDHDHIILSTTIEIEPTDTHFDTTTLLHNTSPFLLFSLHLHLQTFRILILNIHYIPLLKMLRHPNHYRFNTSHLDERRRRHHLARQHQRQ